MKKFLLFLVILIALAGFGIYAKSIIEQTIVTPEAGKHYVVSFGDSVAAGAGLNPDRNPRQPGCDVAETAYPTLVAKQLSLPLRQYACSGAVIGRPDSYDENSLFTQLKAAMPYLKGSDVVVTGGANDVGWLSFLITCARDNCATDATKRQTAAKIATMQQSLSQFLNKVKAEQPRRIVVNTYYNLMSISDTCVAGLGITPEEVRFILDQQTVLNTAIAQAASANQLNAQVIDFTGHTLCEAEPWLQGIDDPAPLHPNAIGQQRIAEIDLTALQQP